MDKITIKKHDRNRVILTETLPYETPLFFSNRHFYFFLPKLKIAPMFVKYSLQCKEKTIPFQFKVSKGESSHRYISVPHPASQMHIAGLLFDYSDLINHLCSRSNFSIRKPTGVASYYYEGAIIHYNDDSKFSSGDVVQDTNEREEKDDLSNSYGCSFFSYSGYTLLYKFFDSLEFQSLEKRFSNLLRFDVAKCFDSIYTHSISWAIKGKEFSKKNIAKSSFDGMFDKLIRSLNDDETNGIIIGPEFSRVFAEVILQSIDCKIEQQANSWGKKRGIDYSVRRYVDDYFVFSNSEDLSNKIYYAFQHELRKFKLFTNEGKTSCITRPFATNLSIAKYQVTEVLDEFFFSIRRDKSNVESNAKKRETPSIVYIYKPYTRSKNLINKFKSIVKGNNADYSSFTGLVMTIIRSRLSKIEYETTNITKIHEHENCYRNFLLLVIDFTSFIYCMSPKVRSSFLFAQIITIIKKISDKLSLAPRSEIIKKLKDETNVILKNLAAIDSPKIEVVNFMLCVKSEFGESVINDNQIINFFGLDSGNINPLNYFELTSILYMLCLDGRNKAIIDFVYDSLEKTIINNDEPVTNSEILFLFFDLASFPHCNKDKLKSCYITLHEKTFGVKPKDPVVAECLNFLSKNLFFTDWSGKLCIEKILERKEAQAGYQF